MTFYLAFYLTYILTAYLPFDVISYLTYILTVYLAFYLSFYQIFWHSILAYVWVRVHACSAASGACIWCPQCPRAGSRRRRRRRKGRKDGRKEGVAPLLKSRELHLVGWKKHFKHVFCCRKDEKGINLWSIWFTLMTHNQHPFGHATKYGSRSELQAFGTADELLFFSGISARDPDLTIELLDTESYHMLLVKCPMICSCIRTYWTIIYIYIDMHIYAYMHIYIYAYTYTLSTDLWYIAAYDLHTF